METNLETILTPLEVSCFESRRETRKRGERKKKRDKGREACSWFKVG